MDLNLLAFETSSSRCGVALLTRRGGVEHLNVLEHEGAQEHAERLLPMAQRLLDDAGLRPADLSAVAFGQGPGGFTGLRVACGVAQGVALGLDIPVLPVVSHMAVAEAAGALYGQAVLVALDARMDEVYAAVYRRVPSPDGPAWEVLSPPFLIAATELVAWAKHQMPLWRLDSPPLRAGDAWAAYPELMQTPADWPLSLAERPRATEVASLAGRAGAQGVDPELAAPLYVRDKVAFTTAEREKGQGGNPRAEPALAAAVVADVAPPASDSDLISLDGMTLADLPAVAALEAQVQAFPWTEGNFKDALAAGYDCCVLREGGQVVGFCVLMHAPDVSHILVIAVQRQRQRAGLGRRLLAWSARRAREHGVQALLLEVRPSNQAALAFYAKLGFLRVGLRRDYYPAGQGKREDAWVMQQALSSETAA
ncbi:bifunctional tRNA (adenosine(37)-N6)-threonylcarbamoyltransferase complex dimerization subunit type 1 TsaB/ribosomal protein alanine acetyltransferase RimI [Bordetella avium]|uniref:[Ribosomal protein bS18]-alanine N-acetyltransferase n=1 Tax=Bordetella avium (strain 197N) TaxID=360910 RepID=Q2KUV5_BORA1|nr:bifunctional tRNA (adenosine(37)-N6)-threonylcarbamoyltransferase complex dimerization subunit type 1 TsaB/ribosomal protein alanine acetyltransferase RimI [Bordetella avium]RIQ54747.1 bifunctional tRNA (adenosine(37)-N6)-threonylcarbamoyltransferase complex dimerization subunit type 1 TsaB/ribosomal protein alanine acetyltransferase RimI [Bordetella avium]RIQ70758.1 bifunctional tRNA (adenosine(37)-N6)-threonylcarbamoyltransferase complex dimerization subunit type 1 TsaB/ribosomal protein ala